MFGKNLKFKLLARGGLRFLVKQLIFFGCAAWFFHANTVVVVTHPVLTNTCLSPPPLWAILGSHAMPTLGFERYRIIVPLSRVRIMIPCLNWNKILLPG